MRFRIASFNVENLVLPGVRYYDRYPETREQYDAKVSWIAETLTRAKADIVGVQEVWFEEALSDAVKRSAHFAAGANVAAPGASRADNLVGDAAKRPRLGLISRYPIKAVTAITAFPASVDLTVPLRTDAGINSVAIAVPVFQRPVLRATVDVNGLEITAYVTHLKSKGPMIGEGEDGNDPFAASLGQARATIVRAAEAAALRHVILADLKDSRKPVFVLGDLNDTPEAATTQILRGPAPRKNMDHDEKRALWDVVLYSSYRIALERSPSLHTHIHDGERDILDHVLVSEEFYGRNLARIGDVVRHDVINDHLRDSPDDICPQGASDHGVPIAEISLLQLAPYTNG
ncbi:MAG: hypothetical protein HOP13_12225 [Alphaproteobacteria bacterium]|nr:hypothetical protein [Alphaproteobacteria bacterium]